MAFKDWFTRRTRLQLALNRGIQPGGDLVKEIGNLGRDYAISSKTDAEAICRVLAQGVHTNSNVTVRTAFHALVGLFQHVQGTDCPAFAVLVDKGIELVVHIVNDALENPSRLNADDVLFALKILAMYGTPEGTDTVLRAARQPLQPDKYMWSIILEAYAQEHPERERVFETLSDPLPGDFLAVALLDSANAALRSGAEFRHPFDSAAGKQQLEDWLTAADEEQFSYAVSTAAALAFMSAPQRDALLALAFDHPSSDVQLQAAWTAAKLGREAGVKWLARFCLDVNLAEWAKRYLTELGHADAIPAAADDGNFRAKAEFAQWLAHPSELGRPPDELAIVDHRELRWPPEREPKQLWLVKYRVRDNTGLMADDVDVGLVGSHTFCLFYKLGQRPPEDCYALHCYWEMNELIAEADVEENSPEYNPMLEQCKVDGLGPALIVFVVEPAAELKYPQKLVALAKATRHGQPGWIVLDGPRSRWYAASEFPPMGWDKIVAMVHVGRVLLGFRDEPDRRKFLKSEAPPRPPEQIIVAYERFLNQARTNPKHAEKHLRRGVLGSAFRDYVAALSASKSQSEAACTCTAYESLLTIVGSMEPSLQSEVLDCFSPLGQAFEGYIDALIELNRQADVPALLEKFRPHWNHNQGHRMLGRAAFKSGHDEIAKFFLKLDRSVEGWCRGEDVDFLAEIWKKEGRFEDAHALLIDALKSLHEQSRTATGSDRKLFEKWFQSRRSKYLELFPERGDAELRRQGVALSTLA